MGRIYTKNISRVGEINLNKKGCKMKIIEYDNCDNILVEFQEYNGIKERVKTRYSHFKSGDVMCSYYPSVYNIGYMAEESSSDGFGNTTKPYLVWIHMLKRCYDGKFKLKHLTYKDCSVCKEWHDYSNFKKWFVENYYTLGSERIELDKDILIKGNKVYSPKTCIFVPKNINTLFIKCDSIRGLYPIGVSYSDIRGKYIATCCIVKDIKTKQKTIGHYDTCLEAFNSYKLFKENNIKEVADKYKGYIPTKLYEAMYDWKVEITD